MTTTVRVLTALALALALLAFAGPAEAKKPAEPHAVVAIVDEDPVVVYWSSSVGASAVRLDCTDGYTETQATVGFTPINGFVFFSRADATGCTPTLLR